MATRGYTLLFEIRTKGSGKAQREIKDTGKAASKATVDFRSLKTAVGAFLGALAVREVLAFGGSLVRMYSGAATAAAEFERSSRVVDGVIASTGETIGVTRGQLAEWAKELDRATLFTEQQANQAIALAGTFTNLSERSMKGVLEVAADVATVMGTDLPSATKQLAKAINEPEKRLAELAEAGVTFTTQQMEMIKALAETDQQAAQMKALQIVAEQTGDAAEAAAEGSGAFTQFSQELGRTQRIIGATAEAFLPLVRALTPLVEKINDLAEVALPAVRASLTLTVAWIGQELTRAIQHAITRFVKFSAIVGVAAKRIGRFVPGLSSVGDAFIDAANFAARANINLEKFSDGLGDLAGRAVAADVEEIADGFRDVGDAVKKAGDDAADAAEEFAKLQERIKAAMDTSEVERLVAQIKELDALIADERTTTEQRIQLSMDVEKLRKELEEATAPIESSIQPIDGAKTAEEIAAAASKGLEKAEPDAARMFQRAADEIDWSRAGQTLANAFLSRIEVESREARTSESVGFGLTRNSDDEAGLLGRIIGDLIGEYLGDAAGDFFGDFLEQGFRALNDESRAFSNFVIEDDGRGNVGLGNGDDFALNKRDAQEVADYARAIIDTMESLVEGLGGVVTGLSDAISFFEQDGLIEIRNGAGDILATATTIEEAFEKAVLLLTSQAGIAGLPGQVADILREVARASGSFAEFEESMRALEPLLRNLGFSTVSADLGQVTRDLVEMAAVTRKLGLDVGAFQSAADELFGNVIDDILGPIAQFIPGFQDAKLAEQFDEARAKLAEYRRGLEEQITALERQIELTLADAEATLTNADADAVGVLEGEAYTEMINEQVEAYRDAIAEIQRQLDQAPTQEDIDRGEQNARRGSGNRKQDREDLLRTLADLNAEALPELAQVLRNLALEEAEARAEAERLGVEVELVAEAFGNAAKRAREAAFETAGDLFFAFLGETDSPLAKAMRQIGEQAKSVTEAFEDLFEAGAITKEEFDELSTTIENQADVLRTQTLANEATSLFIAAAQFAGESEEAARAQFELTKAELQLRLEALRAEAAKLDDEDEANRILGIVSTVQGFIDDAVFVWEDATGRVVDAIRSASDLGLEGPLAFLEVADRMREIIGGSGSSSLSQQLALLNAEFQQYAVIAHGHADVVKLVNEAYAVATQELIDGALRPLLDIRDDIVGGGASSSRGQIPALFAEVQRLFGVVQGGGSSGLDALGELSPAIVALRERLAVLDPTSGQRRAIEAQLVSLITALEKSGVVGTPGNGDFEAGSGTPIGVLTDTTALYGSQTVSELQTMNAEIRGLRRDIAAANSLAASG